MRWCGSRGRLGSSAHNRGTPSRKKPLTLPFLQGSSFLRCWRLRLWSLLRLRRRGCISTPGDLARSWLLGQFDAGAFQDLFTMLPPVGNGGDGNLPPLRRLSISGSSIPGHGAVLGDDRSVFGTILTYATTCDFSGRLDVSDPVVDQVHEHLDLALACV